jgi:hypothetical protein
MCKIHFWSLRSLLDLTLFVRFTPFTSLEFLYLFVEILAAVLIYLDSQGQTVK